MEVYMMMLALRGTCENKDPSDTPEPPAPPEPTKENKFTAPNNEAIKAAIGQAKVDLMQNEINDWAVIAENETDPELKAQAEGNRDAWSYIADQQEGITPVDPDFSIANQIDMWGLYVVELAGDAASSGGLLSPNGSFADWVNYRRR